MSRGMIGVARAGDGADVVDTAVVVASEWCEGSMEEWAVPPSSCRSASAALLRSWLSRRAGMSVDSVCTSFFTVVG